MAETRLRYTEAKRQVRLLHRPPHHQYIIKMEKEPIFSRCVSTGTRVYYLDVRTDKKAKPYMEITEILTSKAPGKKKRQRVFIHSANADEFTRAFTEVAEFLKNGTGS